MLCTRTVRGVSLKTREIWNLKVSLFCLCPAMQVLTNKVFAVKFPIKYSWTGWFFFLVRSLASVALRKALSDRPGFHFDYFTVDLNEELSGINGALLNDQMQYVTYSIRRVLELYRNASRPPKSVILIGHSMVCEFLKKV